MLSYVPNHSIQQNYKSDQITMNCIDLTLKRSKMLCYVPNHSKHRKTTKVIKLRWIASMWRQTDKKCWVTFQTIRYSKTTKVIKLRWIASIWCQNDKICWVTSQTIPNTAKLQKWSNYEEVHGFDVKTNKNVELRRKPFKTTQIYKIYQSTMNCIDLMSKTSNNAKLQNWSNYEEVHGFDVKTNKNVELRPKPFKTTQITKDIKVQWFASIWCQNDKKCWVTSQTIPNIVKLQK